MCCHAPLIDEQLGLRVAEPLLWGAQPGNSASGRRVEFIFTSLTAWHRVATQ